MNLQVSEIQVVPIKPQNGLIAFCSFVFQGKFYVSGIAIYTRPQGGYRLVYPTKKIGSSDQAIFYPICKEVGDFVEKEVVKKLEDVVNKNDRYNCTNI
jgi:DNA-binding cell septation regulator SpoVG